MQMKRRLSRKQTNILDKDKGGKGQFEMSGWVLKRATTTYMGMANWQKRYLWLKGDKLYFYASNDPK